MNKEKLIYRLYISLNKQLLISFSIKFSENVTRHIVTRHVRHWLKPELIEQRELMQVKLVLTIMKSVENPNVIAGENQREMSDVLKNVLKNVQKDVLKKLTERQIDTLELIAQNPTITFNEMSKRIYVSVKTIQRDFAVMKELGIEIIRKDGKTYGEWSIEV